MSNLMIAFIVSLFALAVMAGLCALLVVQINRLRDKLWREDRNDGGRYE